MTTDTKNTTRGKTMMTKELQDLITMMSQELLEAIADRLGEAA